MDITYFSLLIFLGIFEDTNYVNTQGFDWTNLKEVIKVRNILILVSVFLVLATISYYVSCLTFVLVALIATNKKWNWRSAINSTNKIFWRYTWFFILFMLFIIMLIVAAVLVVFASSMLMVISKILGIISMIVIGLLWLVFFIYLLVRLTFAFPILFLENKTAYNTLKENFIITKNRFKEVFLVFVIFIAISIAFGFLGNVFFNNLYDLIKIQSPIQLIFIIITIMLFYFINSFVQIFSYLFLFYSYIDFKVSSIIKTKR